MADTEPTFSDIQQTYGQLATPKELFYDWHGFNTWLFKAINGIHNDSYDAFMQFVTQIGNHRFFFPYLGTLLAYLLVSGLWKKLRRRGGVKQHFIMWFGVFLVLVIGFAANGMIINGIKDGLGYPRPYAALPSSQVVVLEEETSTNAHRSFPSGHVAFTTLMILSLWPVMSPPMRALGLFVIFLVGWSRIALGVHFPADTLGGFLITSTIVITLRVIIYKSLRKLFGINCGGGD